MRHSSRSCVPWKRRAAEGLQYPVLLMPWPPRSTELRRIEWSHYLQDPAAGLLVDPVTGEPYGNVISVQLRVLEVPPAANLESVEVGAVIEMSLADFLATETQRVDLGRLPWAELIEYRVDHQPPALEVQDRRSDLPRDFDQVKRFLFEVLEDGPVSELEVIGRAADSGISPRTLRQVKDRLRIASVKDQDAEYPRTLWRLRMSQSYKLQKKRSPDVHR